MSITAAEKSIDPPAPGAVSAQAVRRDNAWIWQVTMLSVLLGGMLALAVRTTEQSRTTPGSSSRLGLLAALIDREKQESEGLQQEVAALRRRHGELLAEAQGGTQTAKDLKSAFDAVKELAGLSAISGPGLNITIRDSPDAPPENVPFEEYLVHDQDLNHIISILKTSGAQHLAVSGADSERLQRVVVSTTARCVGPTAVVNGTYLAAPYHILAIGDAQRMRAALDEPDGYVRGMRELDKKKMIEIVDHEKIDLPEYSGKLQARYAKPVAEEGAK